MHLLFFLLQTATFFFVQPVFGSKYVALGDSYDADPGIGKIRKDWPGGCMQSSKSFPRRLQKKLKFDNFTDMTCSGATLQNVLQGGQLGLGPQIDALTEDTNLVTVIAGVNDVYFNLDLQHINTQKPHSPRPWDTMESRLEKLLNIIDEKSPKAHVFVLNYLTLLPSNDSTCSELGLNETTVRDMFPSQENVSTVIKHVVSNSNATYVDVADKSRDHTSCSKNPYTSGMNGHPTPWHPTDKGVQFMADQLESLWKNVSDHDSSSNGGALLQPSIVAYILAFTFLFLQVN